MVNLSDDEHTIRSEMITQLTPQKLFRAMITQASRNPPEIILLKYFGAMAEWPLRQNRFLEA